MIARMVRRQKQKLTENWPRMAADATEAHIQLHVPSQSESDFDALLARLGRPIVSVPTVVDQMRVGERRGVTHSLPDIRVVIKRDGMRLTDCVIVDERTMTEIRLPITGIEYDHDASSIGVAKLKIHSNRVFFEDE